jgi:hypothetical protein
MNTADVTGGKPIAVFLQSISDIGAVNPLVAFYDMHGEKREVLFFYFVPDTTRDYLCMSVQMYVKENSSKSALTRECVVKVGRLTANTMHSVFAPEQMSVRLEAVSCEGFTPCHNYFQLYVFLFILTVTYIHIRGYFDS